jgi:hypothetical protein
VVDTFPEPDPFECTLGFSPPFTDTGVDQREFHVLQSACPGNEIERLKDKSDLLTAHPGKPPFRQLCDVGAVESI